MAENDQDKNDVKSRKTIRFSSAVEESKRESEQKSYRKTEIPKLPKMFKYGGEDEKIEGLRLSIPLSEEEQQRRRSERLGRASSVRWRNSSIESLVPVQQPRLTTMFDDVGIKQRATVVIRPIERFLPTYQLEPKKKWDELEIRDVVQLVIEEQMEDIENVKPSKFGEIARDLSEIVLHHIKLKNYERYTIVAYVTIIEKMYQGFAESGMGFWDLEKGDGVARYNYERWNLLISTTVFGLYSD